MLKVLGFLLQIIIIIVIPWTPASEKVWPGVAKLVDSRSTLEILRGTRRERQKESADA